MTLSENKLLKNSYNWLIVGNFYCKSIMHVSMQTKFFSKFDFKKLFKHNLLK